MCLCLVSAVDCEASRAQIKKKDYYFSVAGMKTCVEHAVHIITDPPRWKMNSYYTMEKVEKKRKDESQSIKLFACF